MKFCLIALMIPSISFAASWRWEFAIAEKNVKSQKSAIVSDDEVSLDLKTKKYKCRIGNMNKEEEDLNSVTRRIECINTKTKDSFYTLLICNDLNTVNATILSAGMAEAVGSAVKLPDVSIFLTCSKNK